LPGLEPWTSNSLTLSSTNSTSWATHPTRLRFLSGVKLTNIRNVTWLNIQTTEASRWFEFLHMWMEFILPQAYWKPLWFFHSSKLQFTTVVKFFKASVTTIVVTISAATIYIFLQYQELRSNRNCNQLTTIII
jgi:hypothetical protein